MIDISMALDREKDRLLEPNWDEAPKAEETLSPASRLAIEERARAQADGVLAGPQAAQAAQTAEAPQSTGVDVVNAPLPDSPQAALPSVAPGVVAEGAEHEVSHAPQAEAEVAEGDGGKVEAVLASAEKVPTGAAPAPAPAPAPSNAAGSSGVPTGSDPWSRFVYAIGQNESGWRPGEKKNGEEVIGAGTTGTSGMDASYGRFQTTAGSAVDVLKKYPEVAKQFGFDKGELDALKGHVESVQTWWDLIMKGKVGGALGFAGDDVQLAQQLDPEPFKAKWGAQWSKTTGMGVGDLDRMLATVQFRAVIEHYAPRNHKIKDKKERRRVAEKIFNENQSLFARLGGMQAKDLTGFLKTNMMLENLAGFQMKAAGGETGHLFRAINQNAGLDFGMSELKSVRDGVEARAHHFGVKIKGDEHLYMLCARAHNKGMGTLSRANFEDQNTLLADDYVKEMLAGYHSGPSKSQLGAKGGGAATVSASATPAASTTASPAAAAPVTHGAVHAAGVTHFPDVKPTHAFGKQVGSSKSLTYELYKKEAMSLVARVYAGQMTTAQAIAEFASFAGVEEGGVSMMAASVTALLKQLLPASHEATGAAPAHAPSHPSAGATATHATHATPGAAAATHLSTPGASAAFHDGGGGHALGEGDEAFDGNGKVQQTFPATAEGVVEAAFYELHRGDKRSLADIMADETRARTERGAKAAIEGRESYTGKDGKRHTQGTNDDTTGHQVVGHTPDKYDKKGRKISEGGALGPIEAYVHAVGQHAGIPWCGSFATFAYLRAGINISSLAYSLSVPNVLARSEKDGHEGAYYRMTGTEGSARIGKSKAYSGDFEKGEHAAKGGGQHYGAASPKTGMDFDIRPGDVFWQQHNEKTGHVGIIVGVQKSEHEVTCVTIEGNASDQLISRVHKIEIDKGGKVTSGFKGWGRPAELAGGPAPTNPGDEPGWIAAIASGGAHDVHDR